MFQVVTVDCRLSTVDLYAAGEAVEDSLCRVRHLKRPHYPRLNQPRLNKPGLLPPVMPLRPLTTRRYGSFMRLRHMITSAWILALLALPVHVHAALSTGYKVRVRTVSWIPILVSDLEHTISSEVLSVLSGDGLLKLEKSSGKGKGLDMRLAITGEVVEAAGTFTVTLSIRPLRDPSLPSFVTASTASISKQSKSVMFKRISAAAKGAAKRMASAMGAHPAVLGRLGRKARTGAGGRGTPLDLFQWGQVSPLPVKASSKDMATFIDGRLSWQKRKEAGFRISGLAYDNNNVRHAIERVALTDPDPITRYYAVRFLEPSSRAHRFTQQVLLAVAREDADPKVKSEALDLSPTFMGLSSRETLQTWVQLLTARVADLKNRDLGHVLKQLSYRPDTPNLDLGLLQCLRAQEVLREGRARKEACLDLVEKLPPERRAAILLGYLSQPISALNNDLPGQHRGGPLDNAIQTAFRTPCQPRALREQLWRLLKESNDDKLALSMLTTLAGHQNTSAVVKAVAQRLSRATDDRDMYAWMSLLERVIRRHKADWNVLAWASARKEASRLLDGSAVDERRSRELKRLVERLDKMMAEKKHKVGLRKHLRAERSPKPSAVGYLTACIKDEQDPRAKGDCAEALGWMAKTFPRLRTSALAALKTLQGEATDSRVQSRIKSALWGIERVMKAKRQPGQRARDEVCR